MLIDTIAVVYWRNGSREPIRRLAAAVSIKQVLQILTDIPHINRAHVADDLTYMDKKNKE